MKLYNANIKDWDNFIKDSYQNNIFCSTDFLDALKIKYDIIFIKNNNKIYLGAIVIRNKNFNKEDIFMYQGILFNKNVEDLSFHKKITLQLKAIDFLLSKLEKKYSQINFSLHHTIKDLRSFQWFHYHQAKKGIFNISLRYTGLVLLNKYPCFNDYLKSIRVLRRREYHKAIKNKLRIEFSSDIGILDFLHELTFARQGIKRDEVLKRNLKDISQYALSKGLGKLIVCKNSQGKAIGATLFLFYNRGGYYLFGANDPQYRGTGCGTLLILENIKYGFSNKLSFIDVCGINSPNRGDYKTSFNAIPTPYFEVFWKKP